MPYTKNCTKVKKLLFFKQEILIFQFSIYYYFSTWIVCTHILVTLAGGSSTLKSGIIIRVNRPFPSLLPLQALTMGADE
jgi:hypothetical protein